MGCFEKTLRDSKDLRDYLRSQTGIEYDEKTSEGKDEWIKAARELQDHTARTLNDVYVDAGVIGVKATTSKLIKDYRNKTGVTKDAIPDDELLKSVAQQAQNLGTNPETGKIEIQSIENPKAYDNTVSQAGKELTDAAVKKFPAKELLAQEPLPKETKNDMAGLSHSDWFLKNKDKFTPDEFAAIKENLSGNEEDKQKAIDEIVAKKEEVKNQPISEIKNTDNEKNNTTDGRSESQVDKSSSNNNSKPEKEKGIIERAKNIMTVDPYDRVLQHFIDGGKIDNSVVDALFGNNKKTTEGQRKSMTGLIKKGGQTIDQLAHSLWESDKTENHTTQDYKNAIEDVLSSHTSSASMAKELVSRNDPDEALKRFLNDRYGENLGSKEDVLDAVSIVEGMSADEINHLLQLDADNVNEEELNNFISQLKNKNDATEKGNITENNQQQHQNGSESGQAAETGRGNSTKQSGEVKKEKVNEGGGKEPPTETPTIEEVNPPDEEGFASVRKEKLKEIEGAKKIFEKREKIPWTETYQKGLENVQKMYPNKTLYEAMKARVDSFAAKLDAGEIFNPTSEDNAVFTVFRAETDKRIGQIEGLNSDDATERNAALLEAEPLEQDLLNIARVTNPEGEAGRAFNILQSLAKLDPNNGLKLMRMKISRAKGGEPLTPEEQAWTEQKFNEYKEAQRQENVVREQAMKEDFDKKISDLEAQLKEKGTKPNVDKTTKEKTLNQSGKDVADKIRKLKLSGTQVDFTFGTWNLAVEGIAKLVEGGATIAEAIKTLIDKKEIGFNNEQDQKNFEDLFVEQLNKKSPEETLDAIKEYAKENDLTDVSKEMVGKNLISDYVNSHIGEVDQKDLLNTAAKDLKEVLSDITKKKLIEAYLKEGDYKQETKKQLEDGLQQKKAELKKIAKSELTADQVQKIKLQQAKDQAERDIKEYERRIKAGDYEDKPYQPLTETDAELIKIDKRKASIETEFRKKQRELREANKSTIERLADFARSVYVSFLIGATHTFAKVGALAALRPVSEALTKVTLGKLYNTFFPGIAKAARAGGEGSNFRDIQKGFAAYFMQRGEKGVEELSAKSEAAYQKANKDYQDYKNNYDKLKEANPKVQLPEMEKQLKSLESDRKEKLLSTLGNLAYQFIGGSSLKDAFKSLMERSNEIEKQFGRVEGESVKDARVSKNDVGKSILGDIGKFVGSEAKEMSYVLGFLGRSHSALKTFSGRFSFAAGFMARMEAAVDNKEELTSDRVLEIAHESYLDWERGKYQQKNAITDLWNKALNHIDNIKDPELKTVGKIAAQALRFDVAITRVPVNILHEAVVEYTFGAVKAAILGTKAVRSAKESLAEDGILKGQEGFKQALRERVSQMNPEQAAAIVRAFRKGGVGVGLYALAAITGAIHFGVFPHLGQKKKKDEDKLAADELNPGQVMFGNNKYGEIVSGILEHIPALWPMFMGLGMQQEYHNQIKKGRSTPEAVAQSFYTHLKILEGSIPQTKLIEGTQENVVNTIKKRLMDSGVLSKSLPNGYDRSDKADNNFKFVMDNGGKLPVFTPTTIEIPSTDKGGNPVMKKLNELPEKDVTEFNNERKANLKESIQSYMDGEEVYLDQYGKVGLRETGAHYDPKTFKELTPAQKEELWPLLGRKATVETKKKLYPQ